MPLRKLIVQFQHSWRSNHSSEGPEVRKHILIIQYVPSSQKISKPLRSDQTTACQRISDLTKSGFPSILSHCVVACFAISHFVITLLVRICGESVLCR